MSTVQTQPELFEQLQVFVKEYNSTAKVLKLALVLRDFDLYDSEFPLDWVIDLANQLYEQATISLIEAQLGLGLVESGDTWPHLITGVSVEIQEDYLLSQIDPGTSAFPAYIPASVINPKQFEFLKYRTITLHYHFKDTFPTEWPDRPYSYPYEECPVSLGYPPDLWMAWPYPNLTDSNPLVWMAVWMGIGNMLPVAHWRYTVEPEWLMLLTANPNSPDYWMQEEIFDCFRQAQESDGDPWWDPENPSWISRGINDSWVDSYEELKARGAAPNAYRRPLRWLANAGCTYYRFSQEPTIDRVELQVRMHLFPAKIYGPNVEEPGGGPGIFLPGLGLLGTFGLDFSLVQARTEETAMMDIFEWMFEKGGDEGP